MAREAARMLGLLVCLTCLIFSLAAVASSLVPDEADLFPPVPQLAALLLPLATLALVMVPVAELCGGRRIAAVLALSAALGLACTLTGVWRASGGSLRLSLPASVQDMVADQYPGSAQGGTPAQGQGGVRVMTVNAHVGQADAAQIVALVRDLSVDVLFLQEVTPGLQERLLSAGLGQLLPERAGAALGEQVWSRLPMSDAVDDAVGYSGSSMAGATLQTPVGRLRVVSVHTCSPTPGYERYWNQSLSDVASLPDRDPVGTPQDTYLLAGDFNATSGNASFRFVLGRGLTDAASLTGTWWHGTWPSFAPVAALDHVLLPDGLGVGKLSYVDVSGTDHVGIVCDVVAS